MTPEIIGRTEEIKILKDALVSAQRESEMISVIGRRRVGKTFLIRTVYHDKIVFQVTGIQNAQGDEQLRSFMRQLRLSFPELVVNEEVQDWINAFFALVECLQKTDLSKRNVIFFDEVPWLATRRSSFLRALGFFWNSWAVRNNVVVVVCGSSASWMIKKIIRSTDGLYNRITKRIILHPFNLSETEAYLKSRHVKFDRYQLAQLYMTMGGIPHYLKELENGMSADQNIANICFSNNGLLNNEFENLYPALFEKAENHVAVIRALGSKWSGMLRTEIVAKTHLSNGGGLTRVLDELQQSGFITAYYPFVEKNSRLIYRLTDEYSLFYLHFVENKRIRGAETWLKASQSQAYKIWRGYAFENLALKHTLQLKRGLQIAGIYSEDSSFYRPAKDGLPGVQIDLLIDRADHCINVCEIKFYNEEFVVSKDYKEKLRQKLKVFRRATKTKKQLFLTLITTFGIEVNEHSVGTIDKVLDINAFFRTE